MHRKGTIMKHAATNEKKYIIALDQGTTSSRAVLFDRQARAKAAASFPITQYYPKPGWVEHDPLEIYRTQKDALIQVIAQAGARPEDIAALGITNQRETVVLWDKTTGTPVYNAIVWQCRRTAPLCAELEHAGHAERIRDRTGLIIDAYFSGTKIAWLLNTVPGLRERAQNGDILAGTIDTWLIWKLSGGALHITDTTNASRTMLFNIHTLSWDDELLALLDIPRALLPEVRRSGEVYGVTDERECGFSIPIAAAAGDQQAALFGQGCWSAGQAKNTYGTGCFLLMHIGGEPLRSRHNLITTVAAAADGTAQYALEGSIFMGGAVVKWLRDELGLISYAHECDILAETVSDTNGAVLVPAFTGLGAPYWDMYARGTLLGLTRGVSKAHICRAALEAIAFQVSDVLRCMCADSGQALPELKADGGASVSNVMMQFQADILDTPVVRPANTETTALGAAFLAGLACGFWKDTETLLEHWQLDHVFTPCMEPPRRGALLSEWKRAIERSRNWAQE